MGFLRSLKKMIKNTNHNVTQLDQVQKELAQLQQAIKEAHHLQQIQSDMLLKLTHQLAGHDIAKAHFRNLKSPGAEQNDVPFNQAIKEVPLLLADKTYNSSHPNYNADLVRNDPHRVFNAEKSSWNPTYRKLLPFIHQQNNASYLDNSVWQNILQEAREELLTIPHASEIFKNQTYLENYVADLTHCYQAHYIPGWVNLNVALFLYWLVRQNQPKTIVQTGVCNGFSSAFIALALVKNGNGGKLYAIDLPAIFDPKDPSWTMKNSIYGVVVPTSKSPGWMIPDAYRDCLKLQLGDAKQLLPSLVNHLDSIDMFYHDSDHTYHHMLFEFQEVRRKLSAGSLVVADDIAWNASLWDFADAQQVAAYNYQGTAGVAFF